MEKTYCVYCHTNKQNGKKYIGITSQRLHGRWKFGEGYKTCSEFYADIKKYGWDGFEHEVLKTGITAEEASNLEAHYIEIFSTRDPEKGYNRRPGGESHCFVSKATREKISASLKGRTLSKETLAKRSKTMKGHFVSEKTREKIGEKHRGKKASDELRCKLKEAHQKEAKPVQKILPDGTVIAEYSSIHEAARQNNTKSVLIRNVCNGKQEKTRSGIWRYA